MNTGEERSLMQSLLDWLAEVDQCFPVLMFPLHRCGKVALASDSIRRQ
jgi:hypothetical protein